MFWVVDKDSYKEFNEYLKENNLSVLSTFEESDGTIVELSSGDLFKFTIPFKGVAQPTLEVDNTQDLIWGKDPTKHVVSAEVVDDKLILFRELKTGEIVKEERPTKLWLLSDKPYPGFNKLEGNRHFKYLKFYKDLNTYITARKASYQYNLFSAMHPVEANLVCSGISYFKDTRVEDVSILSFDIESSGIKHDKNSKIFMISNTFRKKGVITKKLFVETPEFKEELEEYSDYVFCNNQKDLIDKWSNWVREINPSILVGHNIYGYDLPYMDYCAKKAGTTLKLGRDNSDLWFAERESKFRKDGSQFYHYKKAYVFGRSLIDTMFLSIKHDIGRQYENYRLKNIIAHEGLETKDRQHYDAGNIHKNIKIKEEWVKITKYACDDSDDSLKLFDLMIPPFFYLTPHIPMIFEDMINRASGSQINNFMIRAYLQENHSIPKASEAEKFEGAISIGNPGIYKNVWKVDVASLYPSIMRQWKVSSKEKDPNDYFIKMVEYFTLERLSNKKKAQETKDPYYKNMEQAQKIVINSAYGFLGANGLSFNAPDKAAFITAKGREILTTSIEWAKSKGYSLVNADTDSISISNNLDLSKKEREELLADLNSKYPDLIKWEDDGYYPSFVVVKAKNYVTVREDGKVKVKGAALLATSKEPALKELNSRFLNTLAGLSQETPEDIYLEYVKEACNIKDISRWASKKTITEKVLNGTRSNETKVLEALGDTDFSEGDKIYTFFRKDGSIALKEDFNGDYDMSVMHKKLYNSIKTFETVLDMSKFINYSLKRNQKLLEDL